jgi:integrase
MRTPEFPLTVPRGSLHVTIYETPTKGYPHYTLVYYQDGLRKRESSADFLAIRNRADEVLADLDEGKPTLAGALKASERSEFKRAKSAVSKSGVPLDVAARHFAEAVRLLGSDLVIEAAREYAKRHPVKMLAKLVADVVTEFLDEKEKQGRSERHVETLSSHCKRFGGAVSMNVGSVTAGDVDVFLDSLNVGARTRDNVANSIRTLFEFAKRKRYLPSDFDELSRVTRLDNGEDGPIEIYTPKEIAALLEAADESLVPFIAIGGFAGLRSSEIRRLDWQDVKFDSDCIIVQKGKVKKRGKSRRIVPMPANLKAWLKPFERKAGKVWPHSKPYLYESLAVVAVKAKVPWKSNALRHSFVSYRVAYIKNVPQVALEAGNSAQMIDSNYRELVTEAESQKWFSIMPLALRLKNGKKQTRKTRAKSKRRKLAIA